MLVNQLISGFATLILVSSSPVPATSTVAISPESIQDKIELYAENYGVSAEVMRNVVKCESSFNPNAVNHTKKEFSVGLSQINLNVHKVTIEEAKDPDFALDFMAKNLKRNPQMWSCWSRLYGV